MRRLTGLLACLALFSPTGAQTHFDMQKFISRPDIEPAAWDIEVYDKSALAPGYWFVSPYEKNGYKLPGGSWIGPHIFDGNGELIWSGSHLFNRINVMDFKIINVGGEEMLSMLYAVEGNAYLLDHSYRVQRTVYIGETGVTFNMHDFHTVEDGTKFLYLQRNLTEASEEMSMNELGYNGKCKVAFPGFEERDVETGDILFKWDGTGNIPFSDSTMAYAPVEDRCRSHWDYLHSNAVDKFPDGHYLISTRHSDTIYKISKDDGSILWRLHGHGGEMSDFTMGNLNFSRQHHARIHGVNETHTILSFLDNCVGADPQPATSEWTRALKVALRTDVKPMTAEIINSYDHPDHVRAFRRGNYQVLPNGNAWVGWSEHGLQSEHKEDGTLIMKASLKSAKIGSYRSFKFPFVAAPDYPPDIYSAAFSTSNSTTTLVHVSWNGATEVARWDLYKIDATGERELKITSVPRSGFETPLAYNGYAKYVFVVATDHNGDELPFGRSKVLETIAPQDMLSTAVVQELIWLQGKPAVDRMGAVLENSFAMFAFGVICGAVIFFTCLWLKRRGMPWYRRRDPAYTRVADAAEFDEARLDDLAPDTEHTRLNGDVFKLPEDDSDDENYKGDGSEGRALSSREGSTG